MGSRDIQRLAILRCRAIGTCMSQELTSGKVRRSIQRFSDYASDLLKSDMNTFDDRIRMFFDFCSSDEVFSRIHRQLLSVPAADFNQWFSEREATVGGMSGSGQLIFPTDPEMRMSLMYQLLLGIRDGRVNLNGFVIHFFAIGSSRIDDYIYALNEGITQPLVRELAYRLEELQEQLPADRTATVSSAVVQIIHQATNVIQQHASGEHIIQNAGITVNPELANLFEQLRHAVQELPTEQRTEAIEIVASAEEVAAAPKPRLAVIRALLKALPSTDAILSITSSIFSIIGQMS